MTRRQNAIEQILATLHEMDIRRIERPMQRSTEVGGEDLHPSEHLPAGALEQRALSTRYPDAKTCSIVPQSGFLFAAQAILEVAVAALAAPQDGPQLITAADAAGGAALVELDPA